MKTCRILTIFLRIISFQNVVFKLCIFEKHIFADHHYYFEKKLFWYYSLLLPRPDSSFRAQINGQLGRYNAGREAGLREASQRNPSLFLPHVQTSDFLRGGSGEFRRLRSEKHASMDMEWKHQTRRPSGLATYQPIRCTIASRAAKE